MARGVEQALRYFAADITTPVGRMLSVILGMYGIVVVALITSVIVNYYGEMRREKEEEKK